jgi:hypothetical protein
MLAHAQAAFVGLSLSFIAVHYAAEPLGSLWALVIGLGVCVAWSGVLVLIRVRAMRRVSPIAP